MTTTAPAETVTEQQRPQSFGHNIAPVKDHVHAAASIVVRLDVEKPYMLVGREECHLGGCVQLAQAERKLNTCLGWPITSMSGSRLDDVGVADSIVVEPAAAAVTLRTR